MSSVKRGMRSDVYSAATFLHPQSPPSFYSWLGFGSMIICTLATASSIGYLPGCDRVTAKAIDACC